MNSLTKAITIALTTAALSSSASAGWWTGWDNNDTKVTPETVVSDAEIIEIKNAIDKHSEITDVKAETVETKTSSGSWWTGWNNSDTKNTKDLAPKESESAESVEVSSTDEAQSEAPEVKVEEVVSSTNTAVKSTSGNWWTGWNSNDTKTADKTERADAANTSEAQTEAPEIAVKKVADNTIAVAQNASGNWWTGWNSNDIAKSNTWWFGYNKTAPQGNTGYTGTGTTDIKTAALFKQLMENNPNIDVTIVQNPKKATSQNKPSDSVTYTISGKTDRASVARLVEQIKNNKSVEIIPNNSQRQVAPQQRMPQQVRGYYYQQPVFIQSSRNPYIWYRAPVLVQPQQK